MRNKQVEGLRGIAIVIILIYHYFYRFMQCYYPESMPANTLFLIIREFRLLGNSIFFILAGYYLQRSKKNGRKLLVGRLTRLLPLYWIAITVVFLSTSIFVLPNRTVSIKEYLVNVLFLNGYLGINYVDGSHWFLSSIVACIFIYSIITRSVREKHREIALFLWMGLNYCLGLCEAIEGTAGTAFSILHNFSGGGYGMPIVMMGIWLGFIAENKKLRESKVYFFGLILSIVMICASEGKVSALMASTVLLITALALSEKLKPLSRRPFVLVGESSYAIYLFHQNLGFLALYYYTANFGVNYCFNGILTVVAVFVGIVIHSCIESPLNRKINEIIHRNTPNRERGIQ